MPRFAISANRARIGIILLGRGFLFRLRHVARFAKRSWGELLRGLYEPSIDYRKGLRKSSENTFGERDWHGNGSSVRNLRWTRVLWPAIGDGRIVNIEADLAIGTQWPMHLPKTGPPGFVWTESKRPKGTYVLFLVNSRTIGPAAEPTPVGCAGGPPAGSCRT